MICFWKSIVMFGDYCQIITVIIKIMIIIKTPRHMLHTCTIIILLSTLYTLKNCTLTETVSKIIPGILFWVFTHWGGKCLTAKSHEVSTPRDEMLQWSYRSVIWPTSRKPYCRAPYQISERLKKSKPEFHGVETLRNLAVRRPPA